MGDTSTNPPRFSPVAAAVVLAVAYPVVGRLSLLLSAPPGYVTAVFPPAGLAVGALLAFGTRLWPGVLLGSLTLNVSLALSRGPLTARGAAAAILIALGSTLQAATASYVVRRSVGYPAPLVTDRDIARFLLLGGPVSCLVASLVGVTSLVALGILDRARFFESFATFWVGDTLGVLIAAPLVLLAFGKPEAAWRPRRAAVGLPLVVTSLVVVVVFVAAGRWERDRVERALAERGSAMADALRNRFDLYSATLVALEGLETVKKHITPDDFRIFAGTLGKQCPGLLATEWLPIVSDSQRAAFEAERRVDASPGFVITEQNEGAALVPAKSRDHYVPVMHVEPLPGNEAVVGFDVASEPTRAKALARAVETGRPALSAPLSLLQDGLGRSAHVGFLLAHAVRGRNAGTEPRGYVLAVLRINDVIGASLPPSFAENVAVRVLDVTGGAAEMIYASDAKSGPISDFGFEWTRDIEIGGRGLRLSVKPTIALLESTIGWQRFLLLLGGFGFTALLGALLLSVTGRRRQVEELVERRTAELAGVLLHDLAERQRMDRLKDELVSTVSHELRTPITAIHGSLRLLESGLGGEMNEMSTELISIAVANSGRLARLVDDILDLGKIELGHAQFFLGPHDLVSLLAQAVAENAPYAEEFGVRYVLEPSLSVAPLVEVDPARFLQVMANLLSNAAKFSPAGSQVEIHAEGARVYVRDHGSGIPSAFRDRMFTKFAQADGSTKRRVGGTGLGLSISKAIMNAMGGDVGYAETEGGGATFILDLPVARQGQSAPAARGAPLIA